jgi:DNA-directed RNA polymerase subunit RPC12/RpoP
MVAAVCATFIMVSCKKDYQKLTMEFIRNLPDTCSLLVQVENEAEHLVYYKGQSTDMFFCYNAETEKSEPIIIPNVDGYDAPVTIIGAGKENIIIGHNATVDNPDDVDLPQAYVQFYNLKTQRFKKFTTCNWYEYDEGTKQLSCFSYDVDRYGDGMRTTDNYDFDGNLMSKKDVEVSNLKEVPAGTLAAKRQETTQEVITNYERPRTPHYYCALCGAEFNSVRDVTSNTCIRRGFGEKHILYEGSEKDQYACKYCGTQFRTIKNLTANRCHKNPSGERHAPAL